MSENLKKLRDKLAEMFQLNQADLDFGIYRIMNAKRDEITRFLDDDLLPQVRNVLEELGGERRSALEAELAEAVRQAKGLGVDPDEAAKVKDLRARIAEAVDLTALEDEVFSHLYNFFRRYYHEGDFISLRRYKEGVYAIPYEGEEVKLHWANHDQYYVKTTEYLRDYAFKLPSGRRVHFRLVEADTEKDNVKAATGNERRFILAADTPLVEENGELFIRFEYRPDPEKRKQAGLNAETAKRTLVKTKVSAPWLDELMAPAATPANPNRTLLDKHLADYTARNTFDYFIHKDLGGFLRRELDFYIKNEVMRLDDIESETAPRAEQYLATIRAIRRIAHKIIAFLAQIEDFQKNLWLKKKFVVETNYCVTLDRVPEELYSEIAANKAQREEWVQLFSIDELKGYSKRVKPSFLKANPHLVLDTRFFGADFTDKLLASFDDLDKCCAGLLVHGENHQALRLFRTRLRDDVDCIYIDPPYNTGNDEFLYKDSYMHSSWVAMMSDRAREAARLLHPEGVVFTSAGDKDGEHRESHRLVTLYDQIYGPSWYVGQFVWQTAKGGGNAKTFVRGHEYVLCHSPNPDLELSKKGDKAERHLAQAEAGSDKYIRKSGEWYFVNDDFLRKSFGKYESGAERRCLYGEVEKLKGAEKKAEVDAKIEAGEYVLREAPSGGQYVCRLEPVGTMRMTFYSIIQGFLTELGKSELEALGFDAFVVGYPKPEGLVRFLVDSIDKPNALVLDHFAGTGTTAHAVINLNREDRGTRKYVLVEMDDYFDTVLKPRIQKVVYSKDWKDGKPVSHESVSHMFKYIRLESYEDTLNNLELSRTETQERALFQMPEEVREEYMLSYMLDVESRGSASLLNVDRFEDPFNYRLNIATGSVGETRPVNVDLVETFNWLLGLRVRTIDHIRGVHVVTGTSPDGNRVLVLWRNVKETDNDALDEWFRKQGYNTRDQEYDIVYVNCDNNLENLRREDQTWKVRLIEEDFQRLMFDVEDV